MTRRAIMKAGLSATALAVLGGCAQRKTGPSVAGGDTLPGPVATGPLPPEWSGGTPRPAPAPAPAPAGAPAVLARGQWTRSGVARPGEINPMNGISRITIHHDGMDAFTSESSSSCAARVEQIRRSHVQGRKFADIGYHYVIDPAGRVWEGRSVQYQGAHVSDNNEHNLGILVMGNFDRQRPTPAALASLDAFVSTQMRRYRVPLNRVYTHQEINPTACPGRNLQRYLVASRRGGNLTRLAALAARDGLVLV